MANTKKYVSLDKLSKYDELLKAKMAADDAAALKSAKEYADSLAGNYEAAGSVATAQAALQKNIDAVSEVANAAATKAYTDEELAKKVDKVTGKSLIDETEITRLAGMSDGANKVEASETNGNIKIDGVETVVYTHPAKHSIADVTGLQDALDGMQTKGDYAAEGHKHVKADITDFDHTHVASEITDLDTTIKGYDYATKTEAKGYADAKDEAIAAAQKAADDLAAYVGEFTASEGIDTVVKYIDAKTANIASDETVNALTGRVEQAEKDIDAIEADYLKAADKTELAGLITAEENRAKGVEEGLQNQINTIMNNPDAEGAINSINEFTKYVSDHGTIADGMRTDINKNKEDIAAINNTETGLLKQAKDYADGLAENYAAAEHDHVAADITDFETAVATKVESYGYATTGYADQAEADAKAYADAEFVKDRERLAALEAIDHDAYVDADTALKNELNGEIAKKADASALTEAVEALEGDIADLGEADAGIIERLDAVEAMLGDGDSSVAELIAAAKTELQGEIATAVADAKTDASNKDAVVLAEAQKSATAVQTNLDTHTGNADIHVTAADKTKWNAALQAADITVGSANGTIAVKGTDVAVKGLGSAAYVATTAFDASGAAAQALTDAKAHTDAEIAKFVEVSEQEILDLFK